MKYFLLLFFIAFNSFGQVSHKDLYRKAFEEQMAMLQGKKPMDFKRAVWVVENAYYKNTLDYNTFCNDITNIGKVLKSMIYQRGIQKYKTAGNWAAFSFMSDSIPQNNFKPYLYDFDDFFGRKDGSKLFITKLLRTKQGTCNSLPILYKLLCNEIGYEAFLAVAPNHLYIKHHDDKGQWINLEMTSKGFPRDQWIIKSMGISLASIKSGAYMSPLTKKEEIGFCLVFLANTYRFHFGYDDFLLELSEKGLKYYPKSLELRMVKANSMWKKFEDEEKKGFPKPEVAKYWGYKYKALNAEMDSLGYQEMPKDAYNAWLASIEKEKEKRKKMTKK